MYCKDSDDNLSMSSMSSLDDIPQHSAIQQYYEGKVVFLTGGTGFLGKLLIHKLIRLGVKEVCLLSRPKKDKSIEERLDLIFSSELFVKLNISQPEFRNKIKIFDGDLQQRDMGFTEETQAYLINNVQIVLHAAADVRFDQTLKKAIEVNVRGTRDLLRLTKNIKNFEVFVFVSTAYSHCHEKVIKEQFYPTPANADEMITLVESMVDKVEKPLNKVIKDVIHPWPNTYAFSKALTEEIVRRFGEYLPIAVVRPSIVVSTRSDPFPGWSDNIYGLNGVIAGVALGIIRTMVVNSEGVGDIIPADMVINTIFAAGYETFQKTQVEVRPMKPVRFVKIPPPKIFNCVSSPEAPITWKDIHTYSYELGSKIPPKKSLWIVSYSTTKSRLMYGYYKYMYHLVPAFFIDLYLRAINRTPRLMKLYEKVHKFAHVLEHFTTNQWTFENKNMRTLHENLSEVDKKLFPCTAKTINWYEFFKTYLRGLRMYTAKEPNDNYDEALKRYKRLKILHYFIVYNYRLFLCYLMYTLMKFIGVFKLSYIFK